MHLLLAPFIERIAVEEVRLAEDARNYCNGAKIALARTSHSCGRNRTEFTNGQAEIEASPLLRDFRIVRDNPSRGQRGTRDRLVLYGMFTDPLFARVGSQRGRSQTSWNRSPHSENQSPLFLRSRTRSETAPL
jgi:hypothetical protein